MYKISPRLSTNGLIILAATFSLCFGSLSFGRAADGAAQSAIEADPQQLRKGRIAFIRCRACHSLGEGEESKVGPNLFGFFGVRAATREQFNYSEALQSSDIIWSRDTLTAWLQDPAALVPGNVMAFAGVEDKTEIEALILYLLTETS